MKKTLLLSFLIILAIPFSNVFAEVSSVKIKEGKTLYAGSEYTLTWKGKSEINVNGFSVWLVGGNLTNSESKFLGTTDMDAYEYKFILPNDIKPGSGFSIQLSGASASGAQVDNLKIKKAKNDTLGKKRVMLQNSQGFVMYEGQQNKISWKGGYKKVSIGAKDQKGNILGWIKMDAKPNGEIYWDTKKVCDLAMTVCWNVKDLVGQYGRFKIIAVSEDSWGNYSASAEGNYDESDEYIAISTQSNVPATEKKINTTGKYTIDEILKIIESKYKKSSDTYKTLEALF
jgi:hypothetical protein